MLHNRLVISRQFPDAFRELRVQHIASSYRRLLDSIERPARAVAGGAAPRVVLLTPGPYAETYFEHAYLARYLGLPLVEGGDLTVREQRLYLKTVEGLEPVHGMLRRLDDDWCDPLELRADSALGVPGLLQAVRAGNVVMANALGSGFLESPAIQGFLPGIARAAARPGAAAAVAAHLVVRRGGGLARRARRSWTTRSCAAPSRAAAAPSMIVRPRRRGHRRRPRRLDRDRDGCASRAHRSGAAAPSLARPAMVRVYAIADDGGRWHVLPGGMTRVAKARRAAACRCSAAAPASTPGCSPTARWTASRCCPAAAAWTTSRRGARRCPAAPAENLFWLGRYTERTEQMVRLARAVLLLIDTDEDAPETLREALSELARAQRPGAAGARRR